MREGCFLTFPVIEGESEDAAIRTSTEIQPFGSTSFATSVLPFN